MAGLGIKNWTSEVVSAGDFDGYVQQQVIPKFASASARDAAYTSESITPAAGMFCVTTDVHTLWYHDGTEWNAFMAAEPTSVTPSWNNLSVGSATQTADIQAVGLKQLRYKGKIVLAGDSSVTGTITLDIPESLTSMGTEARGVADYNEDGVRIHGGRCAIAPSSTVITFTHNESGNAGQVNATAPFTFASGDVIAWDITIGYV